MEIVTVRQMIESLSRFDLDMPVKIRIRQANKRYSVADIAPTGFGMTLAPDTYAVCENGVNVSIEACLPYTPNKEMMITQIRKV